MSPRLVQYISCTRNAWVETHLTQFMQDTHFSAQDIANRLSVIIDFNFNRSPPGCCAIRLLSQVEILYVS
jgi:hypothetical protein